MIFFIILIVLINEMNNKYSPSETIKINKEFSHWTDLKISVVKAAI